MAWWKPPWCSTCACWPAATWTRINPMPSPRKRGSRQPKWFAKQRPWSCCWRWATCRPVLAQPPGLRARGLRGLGHFLLRVLEDHHGLAPFAAGLGHSLSDPAAVVGARDGARVHRPRDARVGHDGHPGGNRRTTAAFRLDRVEPRRARHCPGPRGLHGGRAALGVRRQRPRGIAEHLAHRVSVAAVPAGLAAAGRTLAGRGLPMVAPPEKCPRDVVPQQRVSP